LTSDRATSATWAAAAAAATAAIVICQPDGSVIDANQAALDLLGLTIGEITGQSLSELTAGRSELEQFVVPFEHEDQALQSVTLHDDSLYRAAAEHLAVKMKVEGFGELAGNIAHEFNNHLGGASGFAQMALLKIDDPERVQMCLEEVVSATNAGAQQISRIMVFGRRQLFEPEAITVGQHVLDCKGLIDSLIPPDIELVVDVQDEISKALLSPGQMAEAILELCENAFNAMSEMEGGRLEVRLERREMSTADLRTFYDASPGPYLCLSVADTGCGMTDEARQCMFDPLYSTQDIVEGTGLGMALVYSVFSRSGGMLDVKSKLGAGTTVAAYLPVIG
jgi:two-component system, cell cycle sensor histidine kinase and response regulator CckA